MGFALPAGANTGHAFASQTCSGWSASVTLDNNVTHARFVEVSTTIPGTTGIVDAHYSTIGTSGTTPIWNASGPAPSSGTVTLTILNADRSLDSTASASLPEVSGCTVPTSTEAPTSTTVPMTTTTMPATSTTEAATSTTEAATSTTQAPPSSEVSASTTLPPATTTEATTTSIAVSPLTAFETSTTQLATAPTFGGQGGPIPPTAATHVAAVTGTLPFTGSGTLFPAIFGLCVLGAGAVLTTRLRLRARARS
jgi:hypothetical protein